MSDRTEQARAEAERRVRDLENRNIYGPANSVGYLVGHAEGVEWADANHPAVEALARVREMHQPHEDTGKCVECTVAPYSLHSVRWPCATYQATEVEG